MEKKVLLLNKDETSLNVISWKHAVCLHIKEQAIAPWGYNEYHEIKTCNDVYLLPKVLLLIKYVYVPYKRIPLNKKNVLRRDGYKCAYCHRRLTDSTGTIDHIYPTSRWDEFVKDGLVTGKTANNWKNVISACKVCNTKKSNKTLDECGMKLNYVPFVPSRDLIIDSGMDSENAKLWERWIK